MFFTYILRCKDGSLYTGVARDVEARIARHASGRGSKFVRSRGAETVVYTERKKSLADAMRREAEIKALSRKKKLELIAKTPL